MNESRWPYYRRAALNAGVPEFWIADAVQDIAVRVWRDERDDATLVHRAAIDAARRYGPRNRYGKERQTEELNTAYPIPGRDTIELQERLIDLAQAWKRLTGRQQQALARRALGKPGPTRAEQMAAQAGRKKLRQYMRLTGSN